MVYLHGPRDNKTEHHNFFEQQRRCHVHTALLVVIANLRPAWSNHGLRLREDIHGRTKTGTHYSIYMVILKQAVNNASSKVVDILLPVTFVGLIMPTTSDYSLFVTGARARVIGLGAKPDTVITVPFYI